MKNTGSTEILTTTLRIATDDTSHETRLATPTLGPGEGGELMVERGPLVGFIQTWRFAITVDPDGEHGAGVFMRNLALLYQARPSPELLVFMRRQSDYLFAACRDDQGSIVMSGTSAFRTARCPRLHDRTRRSTR